MFKKYVISAAVADLRSEPEELFPKNYDHHPKRVSQLLFGEKIHVLEKNDKWLKIKALEQFHFSQKKGWHPCEGWIHKEEAIQVASYIMENSVVSLPFVEIFPQKIFLSYGCKVLSDKQGNLTLPTGEKASCYPKALRHLTYKLNRKLLVEEAKLFLGYPYLWGGRAMHSKNTISSVDCSGLINLLYRAQGIDIPRNAYPQYLFGKPTPILLPGDAIYLSKDLSPTHVIIKMEGPFFIESPESGKSIRLLKWGEDLWEKEGKWFFKDRPHAYRPFFRYF